MSRRQLYILGGVLLLFVLIEVLLPRPLSWRPTYSHKDKNPYGSYALAQLLPGFLAEGKPRIQPLTLYELDSIAEPLNPLVFTNRFDPGQEDINVLLRRVSEGDHAFVAAQFWSQEFQDTLGFSTNYHFRMAYIEETDSLDIWFTQRGLPKQKFRYPAQVLAASFDSLPESAFVLAMNADWEPVLTAIPFGEGSLILSSTPLLYTNYFLLQPATRGYAEASLSYLPAQTPFWTEYYHLGRMEAPTPLRFVLSEPALRWAYYLGMGILLSFILFNLKRRQRPIPVVEPPANTSLQFAETVSRLYWGQQNHLDLAHKTITYFLEGLRERYQMPATATPWLDEPWLQRLIRKSGRPEEEVRSLFAYIGQVQQQAALRPQDLLRLNQKIDYFTRR